MSNNTLRYGILAGLFAIPFIPFIVSSSLFFPFITGKAFAFRLLVEIVFALYVILAIRDKYYRPKFSWILGAVGLFLVVMAFATAFAVNPFKAFWSNYERMEGYVALLHFGAYFLVMGSVLKTRELWNKLLAVSLGASFIMAIYSLFQIAGKIAINQGGVRVDGTLGNASYLATYMVFHIFIAAFLYFRFQNKWQRIILGAIALLDLIVLYFTATRGATLGLIGGALMAFFFFLIKSQKGDKIRKAAAVGILAIAAFIVLFLALRDTELVKNSPVLSRFSSLSFSEIKTQGRYYVWPMAVKGFLEKPILGWGQEGFNFVFNKYYDPRMYNQEQWFDRAHSTPLDWLIAGGALGLISYASIFLALVYYLFRSREEDLSHSEKGVMLGLLSAYVFNNLFVFDQISSYILFFTVLALLHNYASETRFPLWDRVSAKAAALVDSDKQKPIAESIVVILVAVSIYFIIYVPWQQNKDLLQVLKLRNEGKAGTIEDYSKPLSTDSVGFSESLEHISQAALALTADPNASQELKQELFELVDASFKKQLDRSPGDARYRIFYGMFLSRFGSYEGSLDQFNMARELSPKKQGIYFELVNTFLSQGKVSEAVEAAKTAYELEPSYDEARFVYSLTLLTSGNESLSREILSGIPESKTVFDDRYLSVLLSLKQYEKIIEVAKKRVELDPDNLQHRITLTAAYLQAGRRQEAVATLEEMIRIEPNFKEQGEFYINEIKAGRNP